MRNRLLHNLGLKLVSLFLAFVLWFLVIQIENPKESKPFSDIPVHLVNTELLEQENKVYEVLDNTDTVRVTVRAPRSITEQLRASDIIAEADMSKLTDINTIAITYSVQNADSESIEVVGSHDVVRLSVEDRKSKWVRLTYNVEGEVAEGYMVSNVILDQTQIDVTGPKSAVEQVSYASVNIDVTGASANQSANIEIELYDVEGNKIEQSNLQKNVNYVHTSVEVLATKEVPVELNTIGVPAEGYMATGVIDCSPATIKIAGNTSTLANINKISIPAEELNIAGASSDVTDIINIAEYLPENTRLADSAFNGRVSVAVHIEPKIERILEIPISNITISNVPEGMKAAFPEDAVIYSLRVEGLAEQISHLQESAIRGNIDVAAWMAGEGIETLKEGGHTVPVTFVLEEGIIVDDTLPARIQVSEEE